MRVRNPSTGRKQRAVVREDDHRASKFVGEQPGKPPCEGSNGEDQERSPNLGCYERLSLFPADQRRIIGESSNGRTPDSDSGYLGSSPSSPATLRCLLERSWPLKSAERVQILPPQHWGDSR